MKKITVILLITTLYTTKAQCQNVLKLTLEEAVKYAIDNNYGQRSLEVESKISEVNLDQSKREYLPNFSGSYSYSAVNSHNEVTGGTSSSGNLYFNTSMVLYNGGQIKNSETKSKVQLSITESKILQAKNQLTIDVIQAFQTVLMNDEIRKYRLDVLEISRKLSENGKIQFAEGKILKSDYLLLDAQFSSDSCSYMNSLLDKERVMLNLKNLLGAGGDLNIEIIPPGDPADFNSALPEKVYFINTALAWLPDIELYKKSVEIADLDIKIAKSSLFPSLSLSASLSTGSNSGAISSDMFKNNLREQVSLSLSIPIWDKGRVKSNIAVSRYRKEQYEIDSHEKELNLRSKLEQEYIDALTSKNNFESSKLNKNAQKINFETYLIQYKEGLTSTTQLLQQQSNYQAAINNYVQMKYNFLLNRKVLDVYMGAQIK